MYKPKVLHTVTKHYLPIRVQCQIKSQVPEVRTTLVSSLGFGVLLIISSPGFSELSIISFLNLSTVWQDNSSAACVPEYE